MGYNCIDGVGDGDGDHDDPDRLKECIKKWWCM